MMHLVRLSVLHRRVLIMFYQFEDRCPLIDNQFHRSDHLPVSFATCADVLPYNTMTFYVCLITVRQQARLSLPVRDLYALLHYDATTQMKKLVSLSLPSPQSSFFLHARIGR